MKTIIVTLIIVVMASSTAFAGWDNWTINGIPMSKFKNASTSDYVRIVAGWTTSNVVHWLGHVIMLEVYNVDWHQDGLREVWDSYPNSNTKSQMIDRMGFVLDNAVGSVLKFTKYRKSYFVTGYQIGAFLEITTYPLIWQPGSINDLDDLAQYGGDKELEYIIYSTWAGFNLFGK